MYAAVTVCLLGSSVAADLPPDVLLTARVLYVNRKLVTRLPLYTCLETITRDQPAKKNRASSKQDIVQVDVGVGAHDEMYSWPGDNSFSSKDVTALVGHGLLATGLFHSFVEDIFGNNHGVMRAAGEGSIDGRKALHFTYTVPSLESRWNVNWLGTTGVVGERGEFWVDPLNFTLLRLDVRAIDIPSSLPLQSLTVSIRHRIQVSGEEQVLLPQSAKLEAIDRDGLHYNDDVEFSHCHVFAAESSLSTTVEDLTQAVTRYEAQREILPAGLTVPVELHTPIRPDLAVVGGPVYAILREPVKMRNQPDIPRGARLKGRIREFEKMDDPPNTFLVGLEFDELAWPKHTAAFFATMTFVQPIPGIEFALFQGQSRTVNTAAGLGYTATTMRTWARTIPGVASFFLQGPGASLPKGLRMTWRTQNPAHP
jgi:hypothetical protein